MKPHGIQKSVGLPPTDLQGPLSEIGREVTLAAAIIRQALEDALGSKRFGGHEHQQTRAIAWLNSPALDDLVASTGATPHHFRKLLRRQFEFIK